jgi:ACT domain-containing protein
MFSNDELTTNISEISYLVLKGTTLAAALEQSQIGRSTYYSTKKEQPELFDSALMAGKSRYEQECAERDARRSAAVDAIVDDISERTLDVLHALYDIAVDETTRSTVARVQASKAYLDFAERFLLNQGAQLPQIQPPASLGNLLPPPRSAPKRITLETDDEIVELTRRDKPVASILPHD